MDGVRGAHREQRETGATAALGFTTAATADTGAFWSRLGEHGGTEFATNVDFAGLTLYPGGFGPPVPTAEAVSCRTHLMVTRFRAQLAASGVPHVVPVRVVESGWPTGPGRSEEQQAEILNAIVRAVAGLRADAGVDAMIAQLRATGADVDEETQDMEGVGRFGWVTDPEGNRVELWQPS